MSVKEFLMAAYTDGDKPSCARLLMTLLVLDIVFVDVWRAVYFKDLYGITERIAIIALLYGINKTPEVTAAITGTPKQP